ncbi:FtsK/SpoIIIE domain-containing protein [Luteipulveratus sp. YIM 133132]|uniref:FtsK/SpoIIIE domain-containing protein n=1 Tax=Luteipulveratus flavus TaxID=3031728 RepID=UPI0023B0439C|nr:FtsK/SpoIIIE domain-containing protein [Luteipulveratus sp. YIM 133132]MDE9367317.1 FtsK/SpoIIIE domain-containing protein [Luteipulveratus sp. YIM 133132]
MAAVAGSARVLASAGARAGQGLVPVLWALVRALAVGAARVARWGVRHHRWSRWFAAVAVLAVVTRHYDIAALVMAACLLPGVVAVAWQARYPVGYERLVAGPLRRRSWKKGARRVWATLARESGLSVQKRVKRRSWGASPKSGRIEVSSSEVVTTWVDPALMDVVARGNLLTLMIQCRIGQTPDDLVAAVPKFAAALGAVSHKVVQCSPSVIAVDLVMAEHLATARTASAPTPDRVQVDAVALGRREDGQPWHMPLIGRSTLVVGCSGSGKGSVLWGLCAGLAPAVRSDVVRLYGIDLKAGLEVGMGAALFTTTAYTHTDALAVMRRLVTIIEERGAVMLGKSRLHEPRPGDPLHVLVIDELAALTAYETDAKAKAEAVQLLSRLLSQGRALGVLVVGFIQDPNKETIKARDLFTQTLALRLKTAEETRMVLGEGMAAKAPAHKISPTAQGMAWLVGDDGTAERVRADYWPDDLVRHVASAYATTVTETIEAPEQATGTTGRKLRGPRQPRAPRQARPQVDGQDEAA